MNLNKTNFTPEELEYIGQLSLKEYQAFKIAFEHLGSSFSLKKSNGFIQYIKSNPMVGVEKITTGMNDSGSGGGSGSGGSGK